MERVGGPAPDAAQRRPAGEPNPRAPAPSVSDGSALRDLRPAAAARHALIQAMRGGAGVAQRADVDATNDANVRYGPKFDPLKTTFDTLKSDRPLYAAKTTSSRKLADLPEGKKVTVVERLPGGFFGRNWTKVSTKMGEDTVEGFIREGEPTRNTPLEHGDLAGPIMSPDGPNPEDISQFMMGSCFLLGPLMSLARREPDAVTTGLFRTDPRIAAPSYKLRFHRIASDMHTHQPEVTGVSDDVEVKSSVLRTSAAFVSANLTRVEKGRMLGSGGAWPWPALVEKAFTAWPGRRPADTLAGGQPSRAAMYLTGRRYVGTENVHPNASLESGLRERVAGTLQRNQTAIVAALRAGGGAVAASTLQAAPATWIAKNGPRDGASNSGSEAKVGGIAFPHVYEVVSADAERIRLRNPWGH